MSGAIHDTSCHCGAVRLRVKLAQPLNQTSRCDCSFCRRRQAAQITVMVGDLEVLAGEGNLTLYTFGTGTAQHFFCKTCGIYTHHQRRSNPREYGVNIGTIAGVNPRDYDPIPWTDGVNHPSDQT
ncbi:MAG: hypothetical protein ACI86S_001544 [Paracoccaceae bacterium]|jgi:hypothetical protein